MAGERCGKIAFKFKKAELNDQFIVEFI